MKKIIPPLLPLFFCCSLLAQTYTFNGNGNWSDSLNWLNSIKPPTPLLPNSIININPVSGGQCVVNVPVTITATATLNVMAGSQFIILGNLTILSTNNYGTKLVKELALLSRPAGGYDTGGALIYYYDNLNRLSLTIESEFGSTTNDTTENRYIWYYYNGNDTLPYIQTRMYNPGTTYPDTTFFTYYPDGRMKSDSMIRYPSPPSRSINAQNFYYNGDTTRIDSRYYTDGIPGSPYSRYFYQSRDNNDNVVYEYDSLSTSSAGIPRNTEYLPNVNPFYKLMRCGMEDFIEQEVSGWRWQDAPKNLISRWRTIMYNPPFSTQEDDQYFTYTLRSDGYPTAVDITSITIYNGVPRTKTYRIAYVYE